VFWDQWGKAHDADYDLHFQHGTRAPATSKACDKRHKCHKFRNDVKDDWVLLHPSKHPDTNNAVSQTGTYVQGLQYAALARAKALSSDNVALKCISYGGPQIMGGNHEVVGYVTASEMDTAFQSGERSQVLGFADFMRFYGGDAKRGYLLKHLQKSEFEDFAVGYNGSKSYEAGFQSAYDEAVKMFAPPAKTKSFGIALADLHYGVEKGEIMDHFYRNPAERQSLGRKTGRSRHYGIDVTRSGGTNGSIKDPRRGAPVYATLLPKVSIDTLNSTWVVGEGDKALTGLSLDGSGNATLDHAIIKVQPWGKPNDDDAYGGVIRMNCRYNYNCNDGTIKQFTIGLEYLHLITETYLPKDKSGAKATLDEWNALGRGIGFGPQMVNNAKLAAADLTGTSPVLVGFLGATQTPHTHIQAAFAHGIKTPGMRPRISPIVLLRA
jgi:hypothetical protein